MITPSEVTQFKEAILQAKSVFLCAHVSPDGDTLGSMLGLKHALKNAFPHLTVIDAAVSGKIPDIYHGLPGVSEIKDPDTATDLLAQYDLSFCLDCGSPDRLGSSQHFFMGAKCAINIDHHVSNKRFGHINLIDTQAAASGEVVADLLTPNQIPLTPETAACLYVALLTDTGGFKYSSTTSKIFRLAADLVDAGANPEMLFKQIYDVMPKSQALLHATCVQKAKFNADNSLSWVIISREDLAQTGAIDEHIEGLVDILRRISTVRVAALLKATPDGMTKVSLRSDDHRINVAEIAERWNGGGHKMASGCTITKPPEQVETELIPILEAAIQAVNTPVTPSR